MSFKACFRGTRKPARETRALPRDRGHRLLFQAHPAFFLWGLAFGPLVTMYQTAVSKQVDEARDVATSVQSSVFNFSIMIATWVGGMFLSGNARIGVRSIVYMSLGCFIVATIIAFFSKRTLRSS